VVCFSYLAAASLYVDGYAFVAKAASLAIRAAKAAGIPLLLNLGGDSPAEAFDAIRGYPRLIVQTSVSEANLLEPQRLAGDLQGATRNRMGTSTPTVRICDEA
jgi:hypothetical protein